MATSSKTDLIDVEVYLFDISRDTSKIYKIPELLVKNFTAATKRPVLHSGVVVHNRQFQYSTDGIENLPVDAKMNLEKRIRIGTTKYTLLEIKQYVTNMKMQTRWQGTNFHFVDHNAHHFTEEFIRYLCGKDTDIPSEIREFNKNLKQNIPNDVINCINKTILSKPKHQ